MLRRLKTFTFNPTVSTFTHLLTLQISYICDLEFILITGTNEFPLGEVT